MIADSAGGPRPLIFAAIYSTWCMSRRSRAGETLGRATFDNKTHMIWMIFMKSLLDAWMPGCLDAWMPGCLDAWMPGCLDAWMPGCVDAWMPGCLDAQMPGCVDAWMAVSPVPSYPVLRIPRYI